MVGLERAHHRSPGVGAERDDVHAERASHVGEPLEQLRRVEHLDHDGDRVLAHGRFPEAGPLPSTEVRDGHDRAATLRERGVEVLDTLVLHAGVERRGARAGKPERLGPVAGVRLERLVDRPAERDAAEVRAVDPPQVPLHLRASFR